MFLSDLSIRRPVLTIIMSAILVLFGAISYPVLGVDMLPNVEPPYVTVSVVYPGADPDVVENRILVPVEDAVSTISGVKKITSSGVESYGMVFIEFELEANADRAAQDVRDRVASIQNDLPTDAEQPIIEKFQIGATPVVSLVLTAPAGESPARMTHVADKKIKDQLQRISGVGSVDIVGKREREIHVVADPDKLRTYGLTLPDVQQAVGYGNLDVPGGRVTSNGTELLIKTRGEARTIADLSRVIIASPGGAPIRLLDVAQVIDTTEEERTRASYDGQPALSLLVRKQSDANSVAVAEQVIAAVEGGKIAIPDGYKLDLVQNASTFTRQAIDDVVFDLIFGGVLAVIVILVFLRNVRATFISALALPTSVIATFAFMRAMGFTVNLLSMMALSLSIGMLIDDAIVVIENIHRHLEMGKPPRQAAAEGAREIGLAVLATTLSIVAVFVPVAFMEGLIGRFFYEFGLTVAFAISVSLFVSFTLTPMASSRLLSLRPENRVSKLLGSWLDKLDHAYRVAISWVLRHRLVTVGVGVAALAGAVFMTRYIPTEFQPAMDQGEVDITYALPEGASLDAAFQHGEAMRQIIMRSIPEARHALITVGAGQRQKVNEGSLFIKLTSVVERQRSQDEISAQMRELLTKAFPADNVSVNRSQVTGSLGGEIMAKPLNVQLRGTDSQALRTAATALVDELKKQSGFVDLTISDRGTRPQFGFRIDRIKSADAGLAPAQVALAVRTAINGTEASQYQDGADRYKIIVRAPDRYRTDRAAVLSMPLRGPMNNLVELGELVQPTPENAPAQIDREERIRKITILGNLEGIALGQAQQRVEALGARLLPPGVTMQFSGQGELMAESFGYMIQALFLAIAIIYMVLAAQFESFLHPVTIMVSLPLSVIGAFGGLLIANQTLSIVSFIGLIMLMGLVTKNAILLVDNANQRRAAGADVTEAIREAGAVRLRPILMTTAAMIFGMLPVALAMGEGSEIRAPMGVAVIGGLVTSTMLTLLVVPAVYSAFENARVRLSAMVAKLRHRSANPAAL